MLRGQTFREYRCTRGDADYIEYFDESGFRSIYQHDLGKIMYMKPFRRLAGKRHVTSHPDDHGRTKMLHTFEVCNIASVLARAFGLNEDLARTIAIAHDIGQPPYGACGSRALRKIGSEHGIAYVFDHAVFGADYVTRRSRVPFKSRKEDRFQKLSDLRCYTCSAVRSSECWVQTVSDEVVNGIKHHTPSDGRYDNLPATVEAQVVRLADNLAYITQEIQEAYDIDISCERFRNFTEWSTERSAGSPNRNRTALTLQDLRDIDSLAGIAKGNILDIFHPRNGLRINVMVERIYSYNQIRSRSDAPKLRPRMKQSPILGFKMPVLELDPLLDFFVDFQWNEFIAKEVITYPETKKRAEKAEENIRKLHKLLCDASPADRDSGFAAWVEREAQGRVPTDEELCTAAIKHIATMTDSYVEYSIRLYESGEAGDESVDMGMVPDMW